MDTLIIIGRGPVTLQGPMNLAELDKYKIDTGLNNFRPAIKQLEALKEIASLPTGYVFIIRTRDTIVGYVTFCEPDPYLNWGNGQIPRLLELGAIEISVNWRHEGLGLRLLKEVFSTGILESYLIISTEYYWHWDIDKSELSIWEYRNMLIRVLGCYGFKLWETDDPDVRSHPANTFMVRVGSKVPTEWVMKLQTIALSRRQILGEKL
jgi:acetoin utilization protein AcuA